MNLLKFFCERKPGWFLWYLAHAGVKMGKGCHVYDPRNTLIDLTRPYLIRLGNNVKIARGAIILTHGFEWSVLRELYKRPFGNCASVSIDDNVFVGMNAVILKGVHIGKNSVIGAGAVVSHDVPDNSVVAGNPAKVVCTIDQLYEKFIERERVEAFMQVTALCDSGINPSEDHFLKSYFPIFWDRKKPLPAIAESQLGGYMEEFMESEPLYNGFDEFVQAAKKYADDMSS